MSDDAQVALTFLSTGGDAAQWCRAAGCQRGMQEAQQYLDALRGNLAFGILIASYKDLRAAGMTDAHHIIQDAAVRDLPGYDRNASPATPLEGPSNVVGTPHYNATVAQRLAGGGTYGAERQIAYGALLRAGRTPEEAQEAVAEADVYFRSIGVDEETPTRIPSNQSIP